MRVAELLEKRLDEFALAESRDQGKPVSLAKAMDIPRLPSVKKQKCFLVFFFMYLPHISLSRAILNLRAFAESWTHVMETSNTVDELGVINYTTRSATWRF